MASITKIERKKGTVYRIRVSAGYDAHGNQISKSMNWNPKAGMTERQIKKELERVALDFEKRVLEGESFDKIKFSDFSEKWVREYLEKQCSPKYNLEAKRMLKEINKEIGHIPLSKLRKIHLQEFYNKLANEVRITEKKVVDDKGNVGIIKQERRKSASTIHHYHRLISTILTKAVQWDVIEKNICLGKGIELPKVKKNSPRYLQDEEALRFAECLMVEDIENRTLMMLLLYTGMRIGEALGLEWRDINFKDKTISISRSSQYLEGIGIITKGTKNDSSERVIQVVPELIELLSQYRIWQSEQRLKKGILWKANPENTEEKHCDNWNTCSKNGKSCYCMGTSFCPDYRNIDRLFTQFNGIPMHPKTPYLWLKKFIKKNGLPDFTIHSLRHTNVSIMIMSGVPLTSVAKLAGHSSVATTTQIYAHSIKTAEQLAVEKVANVLNPNRSVTVC